MSNNLEMPISEHLKELRSRILYSVLFLSLATTLIFLNVNIIVDVLKIPATGVKFLQLAPGEYLFSTIKLSFYCGTLVTLPFLLYQIILFVVPGLTPYETKVLVPILISSIFLFLLGILFGYFILAPAALNFFIQYGAQAVEPMWSFEQYFDFMLLLLLGTGIVFQIPVIQIILGLLQFVSSQEMISIWRYIILTATLVGAILTPSTDPLTQILMTIAILSLYFLGILTLILIEKLLL